MCGLRLRLWLVLLASATAYLGACSGGGGGGPSPGNPGPTAPTVRASPSGMPPSPSPSPTVTPTAAAGISVVTPDPGASTLSASWYGNGTFATAGPVVSVPPSSGATAANVGGGTIAFTAVDQSATVLLGLHGATGFAHAYGSYGSNPNACASVNVRPSTFGAFIVVANGTGFADCAIFFYGNAAASGPYIYYRVTGGVTLGGTAS